MADTVTDLDAILTQWKAGDASARDRLFERAAARFQRRASRILHPQDRVRRWVESGDLLAEMQIRLLQSLEKELPDSGEGFLKLASWHLHHTLRDMARKLFGEEGLGKHHWSDPAGPASGRRNGNILDGPGSDPSPSDIARGNEARLLLLEAIDELTEDQAYVIRLCYLMGESIRDAAQILGTSESAVSKRLKLAKIKLGHLLRQVVASEPRA
jgi:RNA polymerase sigma factor (sigma-70 family)